MTFSIGDVEGFIIRDPDGEGQYIEADGQLVSSGNRLFVIPFNLDYEVTDDRASGEIHELAEHYSDEMDGLTQRYRIKPEGPAIKLGELHAILYVHGSSGELYKHLFKKKPTLTEYEVQGRPMYWITGGKINVGPFGIEG